MQFCADLSKKSKSVKANYIDASERSCYVLSENGIVYCATTYCFGGCYCGVILYTFFFVAVLSPLPSIFSALLEDSKKISFQRGFARYLLAILSTCATSQNFYNLRLLRVPVQGVNILVVLGEIAIDIKNNGIRQ